MPAKTTKADRHKIVECSTRGMSVVKTAKHVGVDHKTVQKYLYDADNLLDYGYSLMEAGKKIPSQWLALYCAVEQLDPMDLYDPDHDVIEGVGVYEGEDMDLGADFSWRNFTSHAPQDFLAQCRILAVSAATNTLRYRLESVEVSNVGQGFSNNVNKLFQLFVGLALLVPRRFVFRQIGSSFATYHYIKQRAEEGDPVSTFIWDCIQTAEGFGVAYLHDRSNFLKHNTAANSLKMLERRYADYKVKSETDQRVQMLPSDLTDDELDALLSAAEGGTVTTPVDEGE